MPIKFDGGEDGLRAEELEGLVGEAPEDMLRFLIARVIPVFASFSVWAGSLNADGRYTSARSRLLLREVASLSRCLDLAAESQGEEGRFARYQTLCQNEALSFVGRRMVAVQILLLNPGNQGHRIADEVEGYSGGAVIPRQAYKAAKAASRGMNAKYANARAGLSADGSGLYE